MKEAVFITGGTGFLGTEIIACLSEMTDARIYALVRAADETGHRPVSGDSDKVRRGKRAAVPRDAECRSPRRHAATDCGRKRHAAFSTFAGKSLCRRYDSAAGIQG